MSPRKITRTHVAAGQVFALPSAAYALGDALVALTQTGGFTYRWWLAAPGPDESLRSLVERADGLYGKPPEEGYAWQQASMGGKDDVSIDAPNSRELMYLARMLGMAPRLLTAHRLEDGPALLKPSERRAYCARCLHEDLANGRPRAFRRSWARVFMLSCSRHDEPLRWAEPRLAAISDEEINTNLSPLSSHESELISLINIFASTLENCLWGKQAWPSAWRGNAIAARALLIRCLTNLTGEHSSPPVDQLWISPELAPLVSFPARGISPLNSSPRERVRQVGRPAWRRAALWLTAAQVMRGLPSRLTPDVIPTAYLADSDLWWKEHAPTPHTAYLRRVYEALKCLCEPFPINKMEIFSPQSRVNRSEVDFSSDDKLLAFSRKNLSLEIA